MKTFKLCLIPFLFFSSFCYAGTKDPSTSDTKYLEYGAKYKYVVRIEAKEDNGLTGGGSAVIIDSHHLLTAAHVVSKCKVCYVFIDDKKYTLDNVTVHKDYDKDFGVGDIALGYCKEDFELEYYPELYEGTDEVGKICGIAGYGFTGTFNTGSISMDDKKRAGSNIVDSIESDLLVCDASPKGSTGFTELEFMIASGDSGGGLFIDKKLAGINSCVWSTRRSPDSRYGDSAGHTRVSKFIGWINENKTKME